MEGIFPLPLPADHEGQQSEMTRTWEEGVIRSFNWMFCNSFHLGDSPPNNHQTRLLEQIRRSLVLLDSWGVLTFKEFDPGDFFRQRWINSYGEEVHTARSVRWENVATSLPAEGLAGILPAAEVCIDGFKDFMLHPDRWLKPVSARAWMRPPRVQVPPDAWREVVSGLLQRQICGIMPLSEAFKVGGQPILGGLFGVPKNETTPDGVEVLRLIMDLRPVNENFLPLGGDLSTLPVISQMAQLEVHPSEGVVISSEDIRAMFYIIGVPPVWNKFLGFSRPIPRDMRPEGAQEEYILYSKVLPMGFLNSVAVAQHLHRQIIGRAFGPSMNFGQEIRRDRELPSSSQFFRVYLDNFDLLSVHSKGILADEHGCLIHKLRDTYSELGIPRNEKKAIEAAKAAEMQGAWIDGEKGICSPKTDKVGKYLTALVYVLASKNVTQKQMQMLAGGLVYMFSYRRPLMANLNEIWKFISDFSDDKKYRPLPISVAQEIWASFFLSCFSYMDFRLPTDSVVTASDASESGGGLVASVGLTEWGAEVAQGSIRGETEEPFQGSGLLVISAFDGIGSLRVALDALKVPLAGYVAIEKSPQGQRVLESHFPCSFQIDDITSVTKEQLAEIGAKFPNCKAVLFGGGPPCQGMSGLNASHLGVEANTKSSLHQIFEKLKGWIKEIFI